MGPMPSRSALRRVGSAMTAGTETDDQLDQVVALLARCDDVQARAADQLAEAVADVTLESAGRLTVRGRAKTLITLREKLVRMGGRWLPDVRDLAGLRIVGDMTLDEQDDVLFLAADALGVARDDVKVIDRRTAPQQGYRALHGDFPLDGVRVELQVRTMLQHEWAELNERAGDLLGRAIRYSSEPTGSLSTASTTPADSLRAERVSFTTTMRAISEGIAAVETETWMISDVWTAFRDAGTPVLNQPDPSTDLRRLKRDLLTAMGWAADTFLEQLGDDDA